MEIGGDSFSSTPDAQKMTAGYLRLLPSCATIRLRMDPYSIMNIAHHDHTEET
jgi:hypothetical protein